MGETVNQAIGLIILIVVNIVLGSLNSLFVRRFSWRKCLRGIAKALIVMGCFMATYYAGHLNPNLVAVNINGTEANVTTALDIVILLGYYHYAKQVIEKLNTLINEDVKRSVHPKEKAQK